MRLHDIFLSPVGCSVVEGLGNQSSFMLKSLEGLVKCLDHPAEVIKVLQDHESELTHRHHFSQYG